MFLIVFGKKLFAKENKGKYLAYPVDWCKTNNVCWATKIKAKKNGFGSSNQKL